MCYQQLNRKVFNCFLNTSRERSGDRSSAGKLFQTTELYYVLLWMLIFVETDEDSKFWDPHISGLCWCYLTRQYLTSTARFPSPSILNGHFPGEPRLAGVY